MERYRIKEKTDKKVTQEMKLQESLVAFNPKPGKKAHAARRASDLNLIPRQSREEALVTPSASFYNKAVNSF